MILSIIILLLNSYSVYLYKHQKPLKEKLWSERCKRNEVVLNDCNWCWCDNNQRFQCKARVCEEIDMFGHFKDAIQDIDVGMEGHGAWRSRQTSCTPGIHYKRGGVLCICDEDGNWPNPVCRDLFRILHPVEVTDQVKLVNNGSCDPTKLYLVGCNVCYCPSSGFHDPDLCTKKVCYDGDPVLEAKDSLEIMPISRESKELEVYATCNPNYSYELNNMNCACLRNNRLVCNNTSHTKNFIRSSDKDIKKSHCDGRRPFSKFYVDCNICHCDNDQIIYCTVRKCIDDQQMKSVFKVAIKKIPSLNLKSVTSPTIDEACEPGTTYTRDCNTCRCYEPMSIKFFDCSTFRCHKRNIIEDQRLDCVSETFYEMDCKFCYCHARNGVKRQYCFENDFCKSTSQPLASDINSRRDVSKLHGYCEPLHKYQKDCNVFRCLPDGKTLVGSSEICIGRSSDPISVDVVPIYMKGDCSKGHSFKVECNTCFCLSNGNALCTTMDCSGRNSIKINQ